MDKKIYNAVSKRANGACEVCGKGGYLELHHVLRRKVKETEENCMMLCYECHRGKQGVHGMNGHELDLTLKTKVQDYYFERGYIEDQVRTLLGGKLYYR